MASWLLAIWLAFAASAAPAGASPLPDLANTCETNRILRLTDPPLSGPDVVELQERLQALGFYKGPIDGVYGLTTQAAVIRFQESEQAQPTGLVNAATWDQLGQGVAVPTSTKIPPPPGTVSLIVDTRTLKLTVLSDGVPYKTFPIAVGKGGILSTPVGDFMIIHKDKDWGGGFGTRWLGLNVPEGIYGIHGTNKPWSIGTRASHGCIRMFNQDVETLYEWVKVGTKVTILGPLPDAELRPRLREGMSGPDVRNVQFRLRELGFDPQSVDGRFSAGTTQALAAFQKLYGLPADGTVYPDIYWLLDLKKS